MSNAAPATPTGQAPVTASAGASFEAQSEAFATDPRIHFSTVTGRWTLEDDDGNEFEYDPVKTTWLPVVSLYYSDGNALSHFFIVFPRLTKSC